MLDLRLLLHGVKTSIPQNCEQLKTNHKIDAVFFDPSIKPEWIHDYTAACLTQCSTESNCLGPTNIPLDLPKDSPAESSVDDTQSEENLPQVRNKYFEVAIRTQKMKD